MVKIRKRRKKIGVPAVSSVFNEKMLFQTAKDLQSGRIPTERVRYSDDVVPGLRYVINQSGLVTFHCQYEIPDTKFRGMILLGSLNEDAPNHMTIPEARKLAGVVQELASHGVDVQLGLHSRLIRELKKEGTSWRPK